MTAFANRMKNTATRLLSKYGSTVTLLRAGTSTWSESAGEYVTSAAQSIPLTAVPVPVAVGLVNGATIQAGDMMLKADGVVEPKMQDKIEFQGAQWSIVNIEPKIVNDVVLAHFIQVRK